MTSINSDLQTAWLVAAGFRISGNGRKGIPWHGAVGCLSSVEARRVRCVAGNTYCARRAHGRHAFDEAVLDSRKIHRQ